MNRERSLRHWKRYILARWTCGRSYTQVQRLRGVQIARRGGGATHLSGCAELVAMGLYQYSLQLHFDNVSLCSYGRWWDDDKFCHRISRLLFAIYITMSRISGRCNCGQATATIPADSSHTICRECPRMLRRGHQNPWLRDRLCRLS